MNTASTNIIAIVAMTHDRVIGKDGDLPWHYSEDLKRFKRKTLNSTIIMGRKTWQSIGSKPLVNRRNIVISRQNLQNTECFHSVESALKQCDGVVWIIGGGQIYEASLDYCDVIDVTWMPDKVEGLELVRFPILDESIWDPQALNTNELDERLKHQLFTRKAITN